MQVHQACCVAIRLSSAGRGCGAAAVPARPAGDRPRQHHVQPAAPRGSAATMSAGTSNHVVLRPPATRLTGNGVTPSRSTSGAGCRSRVGRFTGRDLARRAGSRTASTRPRCVVARPHDSVPAGSRRVRRQSRMGGDSRSRGVICGALIRSSRVRASRRRGGRQLEGHYRRPADGWPRSPTMVIEAYAARRAIIRHSIGDRSCASSRITCA